MYRTFTKSVSVLLLATASLTACKKDKDDKAKTRAELLTEKAWIYVDQGRDDNNDGVLSKEESDLEDCQLDDTFKYNTDGTLADRDNTNRCRIDAETKTFQWAFQNNDTEIVLSSGKLLKIKTLNETTLECTSEWLDGSSTTRIVAIFKH
jgi:hypothetical protein